MTIKGLNSGNKDIEMQVSFLVKVTEQGDHLHVVYGMPKDNIVLISLNIMDNSFLFFALFW